MVFEATLLLPSLVGLAVGFSVGIEGRETAGPPADVLLVGGSGKETGGEEPEGTEGGGTLVEGVDGNVDGGGTSVEGEGGD